MTLSDKLLFEQIMAHYGVDKKKFDVKDDSFYSQVLKYGSLGLGESYMQQKWKTDDMTGLMRHLANVDHNSTIFKKFFLKSPHRFIAYLLYFISNWFKYTFLNLQTLGLSKRVIEQHYDIPDVFYEHILDKNMQYSCGYWDDQTQTLDEAQINKIELIIAKLHLQDGMSLIDVGCGWGGLSAYIGKKFPGCRIIALSLSKEQIQYAKTHYALDNVEYICCDYRQVHQHIPKDKQFDRIVSVGFFEHVGYKNYQIFFEKYMNLLKPEGLFLLHTIITWIGKSYTDPFINRYIFPGGCLPSMDRVIKEAQSANLICHDVQNLTISYAKTLNAWHKNLTHSWQSLNEKNPELFTQQFYLMFEYYLQICEAGFLEKQVQLCQYIFTHKEYSRMYVRDPNHLL